ncbi:MAG TPA: triose-phosphate isomerase [Dehalococcoidia bacterium]|nr:triose-phosphate isomerase [Dehalococcoidia bacterium]
MRAPIIAGNWKCNMRLDSAFQLATDIAERTNDIESVEKIVCPPFIYLVTVETAITMTSIRLGAQNLHWEDGVAATGEVGPAQIEELCDYVIVGHSERRHVFGESDETVNRKLKAALDAGLIPIFCVGETLDEREAGQTDDVLLRQLRAGLDAIQVQDTFVVAYEPVWAIGTGRAATADDADAAISLIRGELNSLTSEATADAVRILYGGSVTPDNITDFMACETIDGGLVGGASLKADVFSGIIRKTAEVRA